MLETYQIKKVSDQFTQEHWDDVPELQLKYFPWDKNGYKPKTTAKIAYNSQGIHVYLKSYEKKIRAVCESINDPVCQDSCMEFFFNPNPEFDDRYMNLEMNPIGTFLLGLGKDRHSRGQLQGLSADIFNIKTSVKKEEKDQYSDDSWSLQYTIPFSFLEKYYGKLDIKSCMAMKGNVYKCGDNTEYPHYACWNLVKSDKPDYHRPESFGQFVLE